MPDDVQRLIRKLQPKGPRSFDEQAWPIYVSIVVLCGYLCGVVLSLLHFNDPRVHANAITWLVVISVLGGIGLWSVSLLRNSILRRTLIFSILLSLIVNLSLLLMLAATSIFADTWKENDSTKITQKAKEEVVIPEYPIFNEQQKQLVPQEYEKPVETGEVEAEERVELTRQSTQPEMQTAEMMSPAESSSSAEQRADLRPERAETPSAPRQSQTLAKLSRQTSKATPNVSRTSKVPTPSAKPKADPSAVAATSKTAPTKQQQSNLPNPSMDVDAAPQRVEVASFSRKSDSSSETQVASSPTLKRQIRRPRNIPQTSTPVADLPSQSKRVEESLEANSTQMAKRSTSAPDQEARVDLQPKVATQVSRNTRLDGPESETLSKSLARATLSNASNSETNVDAPSVSMDEASASESSPSASSSSVAQQQNRAPERASTNGPPTENDAPLKPSAQAIARSQSDTQPSVSKQLAQNKSLTRAEQVAQRTASTNANVQSSVEATFESNSPAPSSEPSRMALSRSAVGVAGVGDAANLDRGMAAPDTPVNVASAAANRSRATQATEEGPALSPSSASLTRRLRASSQSPQTSMQAQEIDSAMVAGAASPASSANSSAASLEQRRSNAASSSVTAAEGSSEIDLGPTRVAADTGSGRAEGGGQPELVNGELPRALSRNNSIAGASGVRTNTDAPNAEAPAAEDVAANQNVAATAAGVDVAKSAKPSAASGGADSVGELANAEAGEVRVARAGGSRAKGDESDANPSIAAGGTSSPGRSARSMQIRTTTKSSVPSLAGVDASDGSRNGDPLDAQGARPQRSSVGLLAGTEGEIGAAAGDLPMDGDPNNLMAPAFQRSGGSGDAGESIPIASRDSGASRRQRQVSVSGTSTNVELDPEDFAVNQPGVGFENSLDGLGNLDLASVERESGGGLMVDIDAMDGDGGLGSEPALDAGIPSRNASEASELVSMTPARFLRRARPGATVSTKTDVITPTKAFRRRIKRRGEELAGERGLPSPKTEAAIEMGLLFLSRYQSADGSWSLNNFAAGKAELPEGEEAIMVSDTAGTGLCLLAFLGAGYHHRADRYQENIKNAIDFLVQHQRDDGDLYIDADANSSRSAWLYSHAIGTIALCEAYGMTQDPDLKGPAQKAVNFIIDSQHPSRGGWRYSPAYGADTSVSGWMTMALKSAELAELQVDERVYDKIIHWLDMSQASDSQPYLYRYNPYAPDTDKQRHGRKPSKAMTAVGLLMRLYTGWERSDKNMILGARTLNQNLPQLGTSSRPKRDTYYWYYATQVMFHMGGDYWTSWNQALHPLLTRSQIKSGEFAGSWSPLAPIPDQWGSYGGRLYVTTLNLLSLEVFYRHLPIYDETAK